jgi:two-component sensor histidine kinase
VFGVRPVALRVQAQDVPLSSTQAVPIGLIINELVENALKYAFPDERGGDIRVEFEALGDILVLTVADNGIGMSPTRKTGGGTRIIGSLVQQLGGQLEQGAGPGTTVAARFPRQAPAEM